jgi:hypothetical protein
MRAGESKEGRKPVFIKGGKLCFSRSRERLFYFWATVAMAVLGLLYHWGILQ